MVVVVLSNNDFSSYNNNNNKPSISTQKEQPLIIHHPCVRQRAQQWKKKKKKTPAFITSNFYHCRLLLFVVAWLVSGYCNSTIMTSSFFFVSAAAFVGRCQKNNAGRLLLSYHPTTSRVSPVAAAAARMVPRTSSSSPSCMLLFSTDRNDNMDTTTTTTTTTTDDDDSKNDTKNPYLKSYHVQGKGKGTQMTMTTIDTGHILQTDIPQSMGGTNIAPQPVETLLASWMGCTQATSIFVGRHMNQIPQSHNNKRLLIEELHFEHIHAIRDERGALQLPLLLTTRSRRIDQDEDDKNETDDEGMVSPLPPPSRLQRITGSIYVFAKHSKRDQTWVSLSQDVLDILQEQTELRCPIANMIITSGCTIDVKWLDGSTMKEQLEKEEKEK